MTPRDETGRVRLDELVQQRAGVSRSKAQGLIRTGKVRGKDGELLDKPGRTVPEDIEIRIEQGLPYVSRGGVKLEAALDAFHVDVRGKVAIDVGASTGGFTDCLLQRGASKVYAIDVGYGQLDWKLRQDPRVVVMERTNIRHLNPEMMPERPSVFTVDCSFISVRLVLPQLQLLLHSGAEGIVLIKPQFEAGREAVPRGGVIRDAEVHAQVIESVRGIARALGFSLAGVMESPLEGAAGNKEFLAYLTI